MLDVVVAASIVATQSTAAALFVIGATCGDVRAMNVLWIVATTCLYVPIRVAMRAYSRDAGMRALAKEFP